MPCPPLPSDTAENNSHYPQHSSSRDNRVCLLYRENSAQRSGPVAETFSRQTWTPFAIFRRGTGPARPGRFCVREELRDAGDLGLRQGATRFFPFRCIIPSLFAASLRDV